MMIVSSLLPNITETATDLQILFSQQTQPELKDKIVALYLLKLGKVKTLIDLAKTIGQDPNTINTWFQIYSNQGLHALLAQGQ